MATAAQIAANRQNARKSTGPRTPRGKAASCRNAARHGLHSRDLLTSEFALAEIRRIEADYIQHFQPATQEQRQLVHQLSETEWRSLCASALEVETLNEAIARNEPNLDPRRAGALAYMSCSAQVARFAAFRARARREYGRTLDRLTELGKENRQNEPNWPQAAEVTAAAAVPLQEAAEENLRNEPKSAEPPRPQSNDAVPYAEQTVRRCAHRSDSFRRPSRSRTSGNPRSFP
jgi:hypothetical protein